MNGLRWIVRRMTRAAERDSIALPEVSGFDFGRRGAAVDDLCAQHELHILTIPILRRARLDQFHIAWNGQELTGGNGSAASNASRDNRELASIRVQESRDDRIVAIVVCGLLQTAIN